MSETTSPDSAPARRRSPLALLLDRAWWFFTSVRVALWLIGTTIFWVLVATIAQSTLPMTISRDVPPLTGLMRRWADWSVWESPIFLLTLGLLTISIICGGMIARWPGIAQRVWRPGVRTSTGFFRAVKTATTIDGGSPETSRDAFTTTLGMHRYRVLSWRDEKSGTTHLYADKNRFSLLATYPFHTGLVLLLFGAVIASTFGWREIGFLVPDGSTRAVGHGTGLSVKNDGFVDVYYDDARPKDYYSDVEIIKDGQAVKTGRLRVNSPLSYGSVSLHQATYGQAAKFLITDAATGAVRWNDSVPVFVSSNRAFAQQFVDAAGEMEPTGVQRLDDLGVTLRIVGSAGSLDEKIGVGQMAVAVFDNRAAKAGAGPIGTGRLDPGGAVTIGGLTFLFQREVRFTGLQITHNPGLPIIILAAALIFFSTIITFYVPHRRVRALVMPRGDGGATMHLGAQVKLDLFGAREFEKLTGEIRAKIATSADDENAAPAVRDESEAVPVAGD